MTTPSPERDKALDAALAQIDKQYGKGSIMRMGEKSSMTIQSIPTGALPLDLALGVGGLPRGRVVEIYGPESSGKSTLAMHVVAEAQRNGGICAYIDAEHAMDPVYAKAIGVDIDQLLISQRQAQIRLKKDCKILFDFRQVKLRNQIGWNENTNGSLPLLKGVVESRRSANMVQVSPQKGEDYKNKF